MRTRLFIPFVGLLVTFSVMGLRPWSAAASDPLSMLTADAHAGPEEQLVLDDIARAQREVTAATVFGTDDRVQIQDTTGPLWRTITFLLIYDRSNQLIGSCSGVFLNYNVVLTAAHCLYSGGSYEWSIVAAPGANAQGPALGLATASQLAIPNGWADGAGKLPSGTPHEASQFDWGLVTFSGDPFHGALAPYPFMAHADDSFFDAATTMIGTAGFPGDKPFGSMWAADSFEYFVDDTYLFTRVDIYPGQSGSPIFAIDDDDFFIFSVVSAGNDYANRSVRFTPPVLNALKSYCTQLGCSIKTYLWVGEQPGPSPSPSPSPAPTATPPSGPVVPESARKYRVAAPFLSRD
ncbi:MAG: trypsin-like serine protease [bacterium]